MTQSATDGPAGPTTLSANGKFVRELMLPVILIAFATYLLIGSFTMSVPEGTLFPGPKFFPGIVIIGLYTFAALIIISALRNRQHDEGEASNDDIPIDWPSFAWVVGGFLGFILLLNFLGWVIAAAGLFWCVSRGFGNTNHLVAVVAGLATSSLTYILFAMVLGLQLPSGLFGLGV